MIGERVHVHLRLGAVVANPSDTQAHREFIIYEHRQALYPGSTLCGTGQRMRAERLC